MSKGCCWDLCKVRSKIKRVSVEHHFQLKRILVTKGKGLTKPHTKGYSTHGLVFVAARVHRVARLRVLRGGRPCI